MRGLTGSDMLAAWEQGQGERPPERALTLLARACPAQSREELAAMPIGHRDALLLELRERTFGATMHVLTDCPACGEQLELSLATAQCRLPPPALTDPLEIVADGISVRFRLPSGADLAALAARRDPEGALRLLLERCVLGVDRGGEPATCRDLGDEIIERIAAAMAAQDPQGDLLLDTRCPACERELDAQLDIAALLWTELSVQARRLIGEVHELAQAYGWREADVLAMSPLRRRAYLEMVGP